MNEIKIELITGLDSVWKPEKKQSISESFKIFFKFGRIQ